VGLHVGVVREESQELVRISTSDAVVSFLVADENVVGVIG
jgi:hypothetical protein